MMKVLPLPHRINRPSHILWQSMCVAHLVCVRWCFWRRTYTRVLSAPGRVPFLMWEQVWKVLHSWCQYDDAVAVEWIWLENEREWVRWYRSASERAVGGENK